MHRKAPPVILSADDAGIAAAGQILRRGGLVAVPTETVYGLAARADDTDAVARIYRAKGRPDFNPLIVHVAGKDQAASLGVFDARANLLASAFWPGPLSLVVPVEEGAMLAPAVTAGLPTVALRMPAHPVMQAVLRASGVPLAAPSANRSGHISPTCADHVVQSLGPKIDAVLDGGTCQAGVESTIVALRGDGTWQILRPGPVTEAALTALLGPQSAQQVHGLEAPGQMTSHYAPGKPVRLNALTAGADEYMIGFGDVGGDCTLSPEGDLDEAASRLYACLYQGAASDMTRIAVAPIPAHGVGIAINDRLKRASA